jgi:CRISPR-associated protein Cmr1
MRTPSISAPPKPDTKRAAHTTLTLDIETTTPLMGGAAVLQHLKDGLPQRVVDNVDVIRAPAIKGQLRFWWRALVAHKPEYCDQDGAKRLYQDECALWGGSREARGVEITGRSPVTLRVTVTRAPDIQDDKVPYGAEGYVLFPLRGEAKQGQTTKYNGQRPAGVRFTLTVTAPNDQLLIVKQTLAAWILFGGVGSRTRRGLGSLRLIKGDLNLPSSLTLAELRRVLGPDVFSRPDEPSPTETPNLAYALLLTAATPTTADDAWLTAIDWLRLFRQGEAPANTPVGEYARMYRKNGHNAPHRSNWPESDMLRHLHARGSLAHPIRYSTHTISWPRAAFGLPILGRFKDKADGSPWELTWRLRGASKAMTRLASPLILKPLSLGKNHYPVALWLGRAWPDGEIVAKLQDSKEITLGSQAPFDALPDPHDHHIFTPLQHGANAPDGLRVRTIFERWLRTPHTFNSNQKTIAATRIK